MIPLDYELLLQVDLPTVDIRHSGIWYSYCYTVNGKLMLQLHKKTLNN